MPRGENLKRISREVRLRNLGLESTPLEPGEHSGAQNIRCSKELWEWLRGLSSRERGALIEDGLRWRALPPWLRGLLGRIFRG